MSGGSAPASTLTMQAMLDLAEFVKNPQWIDRVKSLQASQVAHDSAAAAAKKAWDEVEDARKSLQNQTAGADARLSAREQASTKKEAELISREAAVKAREYNLDFAEKNHREKMDNDTAEHNKAKTDLRELQQQIVDREKTINKHLADIAKREAKLERRLAIIKQAESV
jgi:chromosome segregation ATPase